MYYPTNCSHVIVYNITEFVKLEEMYSIIQLTVTYKWM